MAPQSGVAEGGVRQNGRLISIRTARRLLLGAALGCALVAPVVTPPAAGAADPSDLYLVTLTGPGTAGNTGTLTAAAFREVELVAQDATLAAVGAGVPVYRWTTALNGYAVALTPDQARALAADPAVVSVEANGVRRLAGGAAGQGLDAGAFSGRGGAGVVIGMIDSGLWADSPLFADVRGLGRAPQRFHGSCAVGPGWDAEVCDRKIVGAQWFVDGFGADRLRSTAHLSPLDDDGHGTLMASVAAGNSGVTVRVPGQRAGLYSGAAPQARLAVYKACWTAPDPRDDGCSTADLVTAVDRAVADRVDVLNLSVDGAEGLDTVERALLGAAEADIVVVGASGNRGTGGYAGHASPWVTSVGGTTGVVRRGAVVAPGGLRLTGAMAAHRTSRPARVVLGARVAAAGSSAERSRLCLRGEPRRRPGRGASSGLRARPHRPRRQVPGRAPGRRRRDDPGQHRARTGVGRLPQRADRAPHQGRRPRPAPLAAKPPRGARHPASCRCAAHAGAAGCLDQLGRPDRTLRQARPRRHGRRRARRRTARDPGHPLGPRHRHVRRRRPHQRRGRRPAQPARLVCGRGALGAGHDGGRSRRPTVAAADWARDAPAPAPPTDRG